MTTRDYFAGRFAAQEARRAGTLRADDRAYAIGRVVDPGTLESPAASAHGKRSLSFVLPMPPSVNALYGTGPTGQKFLLGDQKHFRRQVIAYVRAAMNGPALTGRLRVNVTLYFSDRRRADISNRIKAIEDALTHAGAYADDSQIDELNVARIVRRAGEECCAVQIVEVAA